MTLRKALVIPCIITTLLGAYIVKEGDTLWDLSGTFLKDPFQWPHIWEKNPHIQNPHRIYPGDDITIDGISKEPEPTLEETGDAEIIPQDSQPNKFMTYNGRGIKARLKEDFLSKVGTLGDTLRYQDEDAASLSSNIPDSLAFSTKPRILKRKLQLQSPYLTLPYSESKTFIDEFRISAASKTSGNFVSNYSNFIIEGGSEKGLTAGDTIQLFEAATELATIKIDNNYKSFAQVSPTGIAIITSSSPKRSYAKLISSFGTTSYASGKARVLKQNPPKIVNRYSPVRKADLSQTAQVGYLQSTTNITHYYGWVFLNKGSDDSYFAGDIIDIIERREDTSLAPRIIANGIVISSQANTSTILIKNIMFPARNIKVYDYAMITHKAE